MTIAYEEAGRQSAAAEFQSNDSMLSDFRALAREVADWAGDLPDLAVALTGAALFLGAGAFAGACLSLTGLTA